MEILSMDHIALLVSNVERSRHFYGQVLKMEEIPRPDSFNFPGAWFRKGRAELHLIGEEEAGRTQQMHPWYRQDEFVRGYGAHVAFEVADLEAARRYVLAHKIEISGEPRPRGDGVQQLYIRDPDGYIIELFVWPDRPNKR